MKKEKTVVIAGADVTVFTLTTKDHIIMEIVVNTRKLDSGFEQSDMIGPYLDLPIWRKVTVKTASQARRVLRQAVTKIDDAVSQAVHDRDSRLRECASILDHVKSDGVTV